MAHVSLAHDAKAGPTRPEARAALLNKLDVGPIDLETRISRVIINVSRLEVAGAATDAFRKRDLPVERDVPASETETGPDDEVNTNLLVVDINLFGDAHTASGAHDDLWEALAFISEEAVPCVRDAEDEIPRTADTLAGDLSTTDRLRDINLQVDGDLEVRAGNTNPPGVSCDDD